jgi:hypothetical protein
LGKAENCSTLNKAAKKTDLKALTAGKPVKQAKAAWKHIFNPFLLIVS